MSGVVQHKSAVATAASLEISFDSPVAEGNLIIVAVRTGTTLSGVNVIDGANDYQQNASNDGEASDLFVFSAIASESGSLAITAYDTDSPAISSTFNVHIYEVNGYGAVDQTGANLQSSSTETGTVSTGEATTNADDFLLAFFANTFGSGVTWTAGAGFTGGESTANGVQCFSEYGTVSSTGIQTATATQNASSPIVSVIIAFKSNGGSGSTGFPFLGSVVQDDSEPLAGETWIGTIQIVESGPGGESGPFLGSVKIRNSGTGYSGTSPHGGPHYPWIGQVVIVESEPNGETGPSLGLVDTE